MQKCCAWVCAHECWCPQRLEAIRSLGAGISYTMNHLTWAEASLQPQIINSDLIDRKSRIQRCPIALFPPPVYNPLLIKIPSSGTLCQIIHRHIVLAGFVCQLDTSWSYHRERSFSWGSASMRSSCGAFSQLMIKREGPLVGGAISGLVVLGSIREQAEQARGSKPVKNIPPWPLHQLLLPDLLEFQS